MKVEQFTDVFSLRDEIGTCPFIEVHLKLKDETPFFVRPYPMREEQKKVIQKEMDRLEHLGIICKGREFQIQEDKVCYTPLKDKCDAIRNLESPKTLRQTRAFCGMVNFLSSFLPNLCRLLIWIYDLQKKAKKFKWTEEAERAFNDIKKLLINPPVLKAPTPDGLF